jgi:hypothetical protein
VAKIAKQIDIAIHFPLSSHIIDHIGAVENELGEGVREKEQRDTKSDEA